MTYLLLMFFVFIASTNGLQSRRYNSVVRMPKASGNDLIVSTENDTHCFHYTWLADADVASFLPYENKTCFDKFGSMKPKPLCVDPMVVTDNGREPDSNWLIANKYEATTCRLSAGYTCAKYSYYFNGEVQNVTRYCTKISIEGMGSMESGCVSSGAGSYDVEVCACDKMLAKMPCNGASPIHSILPSIVIIFIVSLLTKFM